jgi:hypothetical protein
MRSLSLSIAIGLFVPVALSNACSAQIFDNPFSEYAERGVTIQTVDPWPPYVGYTNIPGNGRASVDAVERMYRVPDPFPLSSQNVSGPTSAGGPGIQINNGASAPQ